ncbi:MAG: metalloregulator ArsR/SmtB family transcription factor, partial [Actinobacteria bacterium]|nr:metalloregulator ArsR/SmtB family transcription factor [Actinomycetota bacterium]
LFQLADLAAQLNAHEEIDLLYRRLLPHARDFAVEPVEAQRLAAQLAVLAESHRLLVLSELQGGPRSAGSLARAIGMAPSLASHHLAVLLKADLVSRWREGSFVYYTLNRKRMTDLNQELARLARPPSRAGRNTHDEPGARAG